LPYLYLFFGTCFFLLINEGIIKLFLKDNWLEETKQQVVVNAMLSRKKFIVYGIFPLTMLMEELIFRLYCIGILVWCLDAISSIFLSSTIFSLYHLHFIRTFKERKLVYLFMGYSFLLGSCLGGLFLSFGLIPCFLFHLFMASHAYFNIYVKIKKKRERKKGC